MSQLFASSITRSLTRPQAHGKEVFVHDMNASTSVSVEGEEEEDGSLDEQGFSPSSGEEELERSFQRQ